MERILSPETNRTDGFDAVCIYAIDLLHYEFGYDIIRQTAFLVLFVSEATPSPSDSFQSGHGRGGGQLVPNPGAAAEKSAMGPDKYTATAERGEPHESRTYMGYGPVHPYCGP